MRYLPLICIILLSSFVAVCQETFPVNGVADKKDGIYAFKNATIHTDYQTVIENGTLIIKDGEIVSVGTSVSIPKAAIIIDLKGYHIYPSFIDLYANYGIAEVKKEKRPGGYSPQFISDKKGAYGWNQAIKPEIEGVEQFKVDNKTAKEYRNQGFGIVLTHQQDGIARGTGVLVTLAEKNENEVIVTGQASAHYSFKKGTSTQNYPSSLMGTIALLKQTYLDAEWYKSNNKEFNLSLDAWNNTQQLPQFFETGDVLSLLRADKLGDEFDVQYIFKAKGDEYKKIDAIKATNSALVVPLNFPKAFDVEDPYDAQIVSLTDMKNWELSPYNPQFLVNSGVEFSITSADLEKRQSFLKNLRSAVKKGLKEADALKALTNTPAKLINAEKQIGSIATGKLANFLITSDNIFDEKSKILQNWVQGEKYIVTDFDFIDTRGEYLLFVDSIEYNLKIEGDLFKQKVKIEIEDSTKIDVNYKRKDNLVTLSFKPTKEAKEFIRLSGTLDGKDFKGKGQNASGKWVNWTADYLGEIEVKEKEEDKEKEDKKEPETKGNIIYPFVAYGYEQTPKQESVLFKNATVWTNEAEGVLGNTDVLISGGKIQQIGKNLAEKNAIVIDATGKHLTTGIIDEHSHIAISKGVNEGTQASSAEVSIGDVINSEDINIYRQLAGGVTASQLLHGSANPIGGSSGIIKLRWGYLPEAMKIKNNDPFIKFALGENVKQSNWGDRNRVRYPQTRMGVEQVYIDYFTRAKEYTQTWDDYNKLSTKAKAKTPAPRKVIELDVIVEILNKKRFVTCHSYVQSEITMLMRVAEQFDFNINTFTHILEGYKIADKMKEHGVGGSTFSDWWAYKYEVIDAIPYNAAIMNENGIITAINSDDAEMGRRLNQEAAKGVKYGGMSEEDAWKMVTLNPAKLLHLDKSMGSIKTGKDADVVLWTDNPLSIYAKVELTYVDGIRFYDVEQDKKMRESIAVERERLTQKMLAAKKGGKPTQKPKKKHHKLWHCDD